jgi:hypothetical protein
MTVATPLSARRVCEPSAPQVTQYLVLRRFTPRALFC